LRLGDCVSDNKELTSILSLQTTVGSFGSANWPLLALLGFQQFEQFGDARLDTLFLAMAISWRGALHQYLGRLRRLHDVLQ